MNAPLTIDFAALGMETPKTIRFTGACPRKSCKAGYSVVLNEVHKGTRYRVWGAGITPQWQPYRVVAISTTCACGRGVTLHRVSGKHSDHECNATCMNAKGHSCECSCGGANHGAGMNPPPSMTGATLTLSRLRPRPPRRY